MRINILLKNKGKTSSGYVCVCSSTCSMRQEYKKALDITEPCANMGYILVLPLASQTPSTV